MPTETQFLVEGQSVQGKEWRGWCPTHDTIEEARGTRKELDAWIAEGKKGRSGWLASRIVKITITREVVE